MTVHGSGEYDLTDPELVDSLNVNRSDLITIEQYLRRRIASPTKSTFKARQIRKQLADEVESPQLIGAALGYLSRDPTIDLVLEQITTTDPKTWSVRRRRPEVPTRQWWIEGGRTVRQEAVR